MSNLTAPPSAEQARAAGQRLLAAREQEIRRARLRMKVQFWAAVIVLVSFCLGCWYLLLSILGVI